MSILIKYDESNYIKSQLQLRTGYPVLFVLFLDENNVLIIVGERLHLTDCKKIGKCINGGVKKFNNLFNISILKIELS